MALSKDSERTGLLSRAQLVALLRSRGFRNIFYNDTENEVTFMGVWGSRRRRQPKDPGRFPKVPSLEGARLMQEGAFGVSDSLSKTENNRLRRMLERELGLGDGEQQRRNGEMLAQVVPTTYRLLPWH